VVYKVKYPSVLLLTVFYLIISIFFGHENRPSLSSLLKLT